MAATDVRLDTLCRRRGTVRLVYRLALQGDGTSRQMGIKAIVSYFNGRRTFTRDSGRRGIGQAHRILTRPTYIGAHEFNRKDKGGKRKPASEMVVISVPSLINRQTFEAVQALLKSRKPEGHARTGGQGRRC